MKSILTEILHSVFKTKDWPIPMMIISEHYTILVLPPLFQAAAFEVFYLSCKIQPIGFEYSLLGLFL